MPIFEYNGKKYNVKDEHIDSFIKDFPDASTIMEHEGKKYRVKSADYNAFMSEHPVQAEKTNESIASAEPPVEQEQENPLSEQDKKRFNDGINQLMLRTKQSMNETNEQLSNLSEYREKEPLGGTTAEGTMQFNPESGKMEKTYLTPIGNRYSNKADADVESFRYRQAADVSINGQLRRANLKLAELKAKRAERASEVLEGP